MKEELKCSAKKYRRLGDLPEGTMFEFPKVRYVQTGKGFPATRGVVTSQLPTRTRCAMVIDDPYTWIVLENYVKSERVISFAPSAAQNVVTDGPSQPAVPNIGNGEKRNYLTPQECAEQFRLYAKSHPSADSRHSLKFCADFLDGFCVPTTATHVLHAANGRKGLRRRRNN